MYTHKIVNANTGEETIEPMTADEVKLIETNIAQAKADEEALAAKLAAKNAVLEKLGLTSEEAAALLG
jgi:hypothetical protein